MTEFEQAVAAALEMPITVELDRATGGLAVMKDPRPAILAALRRGGAC